MHVVLSYFFAHVWANFPVVVVGSDDDDDEEEDEDDESADGSDDEQPVVRTNTAQTDADPSRVGRKHHTRM